MQSPHQHTAEELSSAKREQRDSLSSLPSLSSPQPPPPPSLLRYSPRRFELLTAACRALLRAVSKEPLVRDRMVVYGSFALNCYLPWYYARQTSDIDVFLVAPTADSVMQFAYDVAALLDGALRELYLGGYATVPPQSLQVVYHSDIPTVQISYDKCRVADLTVILESARGCLEEVYPAEKVFMAKDAYVRVASLDELLHRMACTVTGRTTRDGFVMPEGNDYRRQRDTELLLLCTDLQRQGLLKLKPVPTGPCFSGSHACRREYSTIAAVVDFDTGSVRLPLPTTHVVQEAFSQTMGAMDTMFARLGQRLSSAETRLARVQTTVKQVRARVRTNEAAAVRAAALATSTTLTAQYEASVAALQASANRGMALIAQRCALLTKAANTKLAVLHTRIGRVQECVRLAGLLQEQRLTALRDISDQFLGTLRSVTAEVEALCNSADGMLTPMYTCSALVHEGARRAEMGCNRILQVLGATTSVSCMHLRERMFKHMVELHDKNVAPFNVLDMTKLERNTHHLHDLVTMGLVGVVSVMAAWAHIPGHPRLYVVPKAKGRATSTETEKATTDAAATREEAEKPAADAARRPQHPSAQRRVFVSGSEDNTEAADVVLQEYVPSVLDPTSLLRQDAEADKFIQFAKSVGPVRGGSGASVTVPAGQFTTPLVEIVDKDTGHGLAGVKCVKPGVTSMEGGPSGVDAVVFGGGGFVEDVSQVDISLSHLHAMCCSFATNLLLPSMQQNRELYAATSAAKMQFQNAVSAARGVLGTAHITEFRGQVDSMRALIARLQAWSAATSTQSLLSIGPLKNKTASKVAATATTSAVSSLSSATKRKNRRKQKSKSSSSSAE